VLLAQPGSCTVHSKNDVHRMNTQWRLLVVHVENEVYMVQQ
jgi:hypothetical protein